MKRTPINRRSFLRTTSVATAGICVPYLVPSRVLGGPDRPGRNEKVNVAIIGAGGLPRDIVATCRDVPQIRVVAVCDCLLPRCKDFAKAMGKGQNWKIYEDFRRMIAREKLDGVMIETTTHARAWVTILAMQAGMDAYIEKPMCLTIAEGRAMVDAARKYNRVTQVGTQQRSMPINNWASDLVKNGALGKIFTVIAPNFVGPVRWTKTCSKDLKGPADPWWDTWTNQAELRPYDAEIHHGWSRWWDYDGGGLGFGVTGWGTHSYDQINRALGTDETGPVEVILDEPPAVRETGKFIGGTTVGGIKIGDTGDINTGTDYHFMAKTVTGPRAKVTMKFAQGTELKLHLDGDRGPSLGADLRRRKGQDRDQPQQDRQQPAGARPLAGQPRPQQAAGDRLPHRELGRLHQDPQTLQCGHRVWAAIVDALLPGQYRARHRSGGRSLEVGPRSRAIHQLRRSEQTAFACAAQGLRTTRNHLILDFANSLNRLIRLLLKGTRHVSLCQQRSDCLDDRDSLPVSVSAQTAGGNDPSPAGEIKFVMHRIGTFRSEACCVGDFNNDGKPDIVAGPYLYLAPDWKPQKIRVLAGEVDNTGKGYHDDFMNVAMDVDGDGLLGRRLVQLVRPANHLVPQHGKAGGLWPESVIEKNGNFEGGECVGSAGKRQVRRDRAECCTEHLV